MVRVTVANNVERKSVLVSEKSTLVDALNAAGFDYAGRTLNLDGVMLTTADLGMTFELLGITESCQITAIAKRDNA